MSGVVLAVVVVVAVVVVDGVGVLGRVVGCLVQDIVDCSVGWRQKEDALNRRNSGRAKWVHRGTTIALKSQV